MLFDSLDFLYMPSRDVAAELLEFENALGAEVVFAIEAFGTRVAMLRLAPQPPAVLLAGHLEGDRPILVFRVAGLDESIAKLEQRGARSGTRFEIPHGPGCEFELPGGHRIALYELTRPEVAERLTGRRDF